MGDARKSTRCPVLPGFDPLSQEFLAQPADALAESRSTAPVFFIPERNLWAITRMTTSVPRLQTTRRSPA